MGDDYRTDGSIRTFDKPARYVRGPNGEWIKELDGSFPSDSLVVRRWMEMTASNMLAHMRAQMESDAAPK